MALCAALIGCKDSINANAVAKPYTIPASLEINAQASRTDDGAVVVSGTTDLPDGFKLWVEVEDGRLPLGAPKVVASDNNTIVKNGHFTSAPLWLSVPNKSFTQKGWPKGINVDLRLRPFPEGTAKVHFEAYFNGAWQTRQVLTSLGGEDGTKLKGPILKKTDTDVSDSPKIVDYLVKLQFPRVSPDARAINLVRSAILTVPDEGRSAGDVQANIDLMMSNPEMKTGKGWAASATSPIVYQVSYDFINGDLGNERAIWTTDIATGTVKYLNKSAKIFSWTPNS